MSSVGTVASHVSDTQTSFLEDMTVRTCYSLAKGGVGTVSEGCQSWNRTWGCLFDTGQQTGSFLDTLPPWESKASVDIFNTFAFVRGPGTSLGHKHIAVGLGSIFLLCQPMLKSVGHKQSSSLSK